ncbi:malonyl-coenzyme:anthocyanin 5-O-glucoside-6'''-O-malonyltransferase-like [Salvia splendens]|uniref:malonyl-coenzyme:anthocyanin 5-O-glucoside-6'''-O-malonyltransferase-like n=1 Tax=Salvia splendens TaxID=180675 RepID=UPI001C25D92A|nr:malonyl-coenzyme:anthocyanin 5-O-glucoside-6'''-O-malonyltransferase-like [Salvia splendens]
MKKIPFQPARSHPVPTNRVRASFILRQSHVKSLKIRISPSLRISTFAVASAYIWTSLAKCGSGGGGDEDEVFYYLADGRGRRNALFDPPVPKNYFGNCLGAGVVRLESRKLAAEDGFVVAAKAIDDEMNKIYDGDEFLIKPENRLPIVLSNCKDVRMLLASGSPTFEFAEVDFGRRSTRKVEFLSMDDRTYAGADAKIYMSRG